MKACQVVYSPVIKKIYNLKSIPLEEFIFKTSFISLKSLRRCHNDDKSGL